MGKPPKDNINKNEVNDKLAKSNNTSLSNFKKYMVAGIAFIGSVAVLLGNLDKIHEIYVKYFSSPPQKIRISVEYMRLFGAVEVPLIIQAISTGGIRKTEYGRYLMGGDKSKRVLYANGEMIQVNAGNHVEGDLGGYWENFKYKNSMPIQNYLWKQCAGDYFYGLKLLAKTVSDLSTEFSCVIKTIAPYTFYCNDKGIVTYGDEWIYPLFQDTLKSRETGLKCDPETDWRFDKCNTSADYTVGFLFVIIKNDSNDILRDIGLHFKEFKIDDIPTNLFDKIETSGLNYKKLPIEFQKNETITKKISTINPGESLIWLLSVYKARKSDGLEDIFLDSWSLPLSISYKLTDGQEEEEESIRFPYRNQAIKVDLQSKLPHGWYGQ